MYLCRELLHVVGLSSEEKETMALSIIFAQELAPEIGSVTCQRVGVQENADHPTGEPVISPDPTTSSSCTAYQTQALFGLLLVLLAHISREKNLQCMEY